MHNIVSVSGGKDSTATLLVAIVQEVENLQAVFADTGHEHPETYDYVRYLEEATGISVRWVSADFAHEIERKRQKLLAGVLPGWSDIATQKALEILKPTGNPFLDLCLWKGRFPSTKARFCTEELKRNPIIEQVFFPLLDNGDMVLSWQGVRRDESFARRYLPECDSVGGGLFNYRPILKWNVDAVFEAHRFMGIKPNPLYTQGMGRVGCMPCVNCGKDELREIARRFPDEVARVKEWESLVSAAARLGSATFFPVSNDPTINKDGVISHEDHGILRMIEWANTGRGGRQLDWITSANDEIKCNSAYGLCE